MNNNKFAQNYDETSRKPRPGLKKAAKTKEKQGPEPKKQQNQRETRTLTKKSTKPQENQGLGPNKQQNLQKTKVWVHKTIKPTENTRLGPKKQRNLKKALVWDQTNNETLEKKAFRKQTKTNLGFWPGRADSVLGRCPVFVVKGGL